MPLPGTVVPIPDGTRGLDCNTPFWPGTATKVYDHGYRFAVRYVRRVTPHAFDLSASEATGLLAVGLGLMVVQHVESADGWVPSGPKGTAYGDVAALECVNVGIPPGVTVWCDLEGVTLGTPARAVIDYVNNWSVPVSDAGFVPGLYVGWHAGLGASDLYRALTLSHYWAAYNLNADQFPATRGVQMKQSARRQSDGEFGIDFDVDIVHADALGGRPSMLVSSSP